MIIARNLRKIFTSGDGSQLIALNDLSFDVPAGQFVAITGRSGSGKSTLLYQISLLDKPTSGEVYIDGVNASELSNEQRTVTRLMQLGYVFQDYALLPSLTAIENVALPLIMQDMRRIDALTQAQTALERVGLGEKASNLPSQLSGGQQQRVSIARAIAHEPKIIFADEPTANLDSETSKLVLDLFLDLNKHGQTIIMVTHEEEYAALADRNIILADGNIIDDRLK